MKKSSTVRYKKDAKWLKWVEANTLYSSLLGDKPTKAKPKTKKITSNTKLKNYLKRHLL